jgi:hypothetical protein
VKLTIELGPADLVQIVTQAMEHQGYKVKGTPEIVCTIVKDDVHDLADYPAFSCVRLDVEKRNQSGGKD